MKSGSIPSQMVNYYLVFAWLVPWETTLERSLMRGL